MATEVRCACCGRRLGGRRSLWVVCPRDNCIEILCRTCRDQFRRIMHRVEVVPNYDGRYALNLSNPPMAKWDS